MIGTILAATLHASAGSAHPPASLDPDAHPPLIPAAVHDAPRRLTGHLYLRASTGEAVFTPAKEYLANRASRSFLAFGDDLNGDGVADAWINTNIDPCPIGTPTDPKIELAILDCPLGGCVWNGFFNPDGQTGDHHLYKCQLGDPVALTPITDVLVDTITFSFWTDLADTDADSDTMPDGNTGGLGIEISFWDQEDFHGKTSCFMPAAGGPGMSRVKLVTIPVTGLPGTLTPGELSGVIVTLELGAGQVFEIGDSDGIGPANGNFNPMISALQYDTDGDTVADTAPADTDWNGSIDWSFSLRGIQPSDGREATIAYTLAAPGVPGTPGVIDGTTGGTVSGPVGADDGVIDYGNRDDGTPPLQWSHTRIVRASVIPPMGMGFPFTSQLLPVPSLLGRFSMFFASLGEQPDPLGPDGISPLHFPGYPNSDYFGWGAEHPPDGTFYGDLNCEIDDDGDTIPEGRPFSMAFMALSASTTCDSPCDYDRNCTLNIDDIDAFVAFFLGGDLNADCDGSGGLNVDDIDCFVSCFLAG